MEKKTIRDLHRADIEHFKRQPKMSLTVVLDNVRSLNNIGAIFRTCDAFAVERMLLCGITATPPARDIHKTALGAELTVAWSYAPSTCEAIDRLQRITGYLVGTTDRWNNAKLAELNDRVVHE